MSLNHPVIYTMSRKFKEYMLEQAALELKISFLVPSESNVSIAAPAKRLAHCVQAMGLLQALSKVEDKIRALSYAQKSYIKHLYVQQQTMDMEEDSFTEVLNIVGVDPEAIVGYDVVKVIELLSNIFDKVARNFKEGVHLHDKSFDAIQYIAYLNRKDRLEEAIKEII
ncbi:MAG: hypothetical protein AAF380_03530 [Bacteroidota bacterium]